MDTNQPNTPKVAFIGFGEAAEAFATGWASELTVTTFAYDLKSDAGAASRAAQSTRYAAAGCTGRDSHAEAVTSGECVFSLVTADQALAAATSAAAADFDGRLYFDCNSCAPQTKQAARDVIERAGGRYVDLAVMAPVHPGLHRTPLLASGPHVDEALAMLEALNMQAKPAGDQVGAASATKLCRSIAVKGLEAMMAELVLACRAFGVEAAVIPSLETSYPGFGWAERSDYAFDRMGIHGPRRSAEMLEAARMIEGAGLPSDIASATATWQARLGALAREPGSEDRDIYLNGLLDALVPDREG